MLSKIELDNNIDVLKNLILSKRVYKDLYVYLHQIKEKRGSSYHHISEDGLYKLAYILNENILTKTDKLNIYQHVEHLTQDFSVLSALSVTEWDSLITTLTVAHSRVIEPTVLPVNKQLNVNRDTINLMMQNPWIVLLLLMEITLIPNLLSKL